jgi:hypothetical protein
MHAALWDVPEARQANQVLRPSLGTVKLGCGWLALRPTPFHMQAAHCCALSGLHMVCME